MPTPKSSSSKTVLCLLGLSLCASGAFAQGGSASPSLRHAAKTSALGILGEVFPSQLDAADVIDDAVSDPNAKDDNGTTALMRAAWNGETEMIKLLLAQPGVRVDERDGMDRTALMLAAVQGRTEAARLLLEAKADPRAVDRDGATALLIAAGFGYTKTSQVLLAGGSDVNHRDNAGDTALHATLLGGRLETVVLLASAPGVELDAKNKAGATPAILAARMDMDSDKLAALIDRGADKDLPADYVDYRGQAVQGYTPLMAAALSDNLPGVKVLVDRKANLDYSEKAGARTALMIAVGSGSTGIVKTLLAARADVNKRDNAGNTALLLSVAIGHIEISTCIASAPGAALNAANNAGTTALVEAARRGPSPTLLEALIDLGADKDLPGDYADYSNTVKGYTPLMVAVLNGNLPAVRTLLEKKANVGYRAKSDGKTALALAKNAGYHSRELVELLKAAGARD